MVGHYRPLFLGFAQGGKAVATGLGAALAVAPLAALCVALLWGTLFVATRYSSIASLSSCIAMPLLAFVFGAPPPVLVFLTVACAAVIVFHRKNVGRLLRGTENRFGFSRRPWDWRTPRAPDAPPPPG
jgi:glycerol-3-phosphate acyltransferase PlsY